MNSVFISHSHKDKIFARYIASNLEKLGFKVWIDEAEINIGESLTEKIAKYINESENIIAIYGSLKSSSWHKVLGYRVHIPSNVIPSNLG